MPNAAVLSHALENIEFTASTMSVKFQSGCKFEILMFDLLLTFHERYSCEIVEFL